MPRPVALPAPDRRRRPPRHGHPQGPTVVRGRITNRGIAAALAERSEGAAAGE